MHQVREYFGKCVGEVRYGDRFNAATIFPSLNDVSVPARSELLQDGRHSLAAELERQLGSYRTLIEAAEEPVEQGCWL